jgi:hypothetical protein
MYVLPVDEHPAIHSDKAHRLLATTEVSTNDDSLDGPAGDDGELSSRSTALDVDDSLIDDPDHRWLDEHEREDGLDPGDVDKSDSDATVLVDPVGTHRYGPVKMERFTSDVDSAHSQLYGPVKMESVTPDMDSSNQSTDKDNSLHNPEYFLNYSPKSRPINFNQSNIDTIPRNSDLSNLSSLAYQLSCTSGDDSTPVIRHTGGGVQCEICQNVYANRDKLTRHMRTHIRGKPNQFPCAICGRSFRDNYNLNTHMRIHNNDRPFKCDVCERSFIQKGGLKKHMETHEREQQNDVETHKREQQNDMETRERDAM